MGEPSADPTPGRGTAPVAGVNDASEQVAISPDDFLLESEVRVAMAWNGGVSLAVWMGGAAVEFDCARRAHLASEPGDACDRVVYHELLKGFGSELVLDILAGASAGGLNGALLAGAVSKQRRVNADFVRKQWLELGDFSKLLQPTQAWMPPSLMQGRLFLTSVLRSFRALLDEPGPDWEPAALEQETRPADDQVRLAELPQGQLDAIAAGGSLQSTVLLDVQATDVTGELHGLADQWRQVMYAREYRTPVRFRNPADFTALTLATAARASSSFPVAFEPQELSGATATLAGLGGKTRFAIDGGLLENAPIKAALDLIPLRPAEKLVRRFVCYVNAAPTRLSADSGPIQEPTIRDVIGYVVNLPRVGREIDQLYAVKTAIRRAEATGYTEESLLGLDRASLRAVAGELLPAYRRMRAVLSLEELLSDVGTGPGALSVNAVSLVDDVFRRIENDPRLPWVPDSIDVSPEPAEWRWGLRAAQRVLFLELDILRQAIRRPRSAEHALSAMELKTLLEYRAEIHDAIGKLEELRAEFLANEEIRSLAALIALAVDPAVELDALNRAMNESGLRTRALAILRAGSSSFYEAVKIISGTRGVTLTTDYLFGEAASERFDDPAFVHFLERALAIEVVRRSLAFDQDIDSAQPLSFAQLTPFVPCKIMTRRPFSEDGPASSDEKLTGTKLAHFSGFYRSSWRANDFMWGRLDAAARIVDLLVDPLRAQHLPVDPERWAELADALAPEGDGPVQTDLRELASEALSDLTAAADADLEPVRLALSAAPPGTLAQALRTAITADLTAGKGLFTRVVCARAAQYEVLCPELHQLVTQTTEDAKAGAFTAPLTWDTTGSLFPALGELRRYEEKGRSLPELLGRDLPEEGASALALRTLSHAGLVAIAALPAARIPLARTFAVVRSPLLSVYGTVARSWWQRLTVAWVFFAAAMFLAARLVTLAPTPVGNTGSQSHQYHVPLGAVWTPAALAWWVAALAAVGVVIVPAWRARSSRGVTRIEQAVAALALFALGGGVAFILAAVQYGFAVAVTGWGATFDPPEAVLWIVLAIGGVLTPLLRHVPSRGGLQKSAEPTLARLTTMTLVISLAAGLLLGFSVADVAKAAVGDSVWRSAAASCAFASVVACLVYVFCSWRQVGQAKKALGTHLSRWRTAPAALPPPPVDPSLEP